jgi:hypothetical protein
LNLGETTFPRRAFCSGRIRGPEKYFLGWQLYRAGLSANSAIQNFRIRLQQVHETPRRRRFFHGVTKPELVMPLCDTDDSTEDKEFLPKARIGTNSPYCFVGKSDFCQVNTQEYERILRRF